MKLHMLLECVLMTIILLAYFTSEWPLTSMNSDVLDDIFSHGETLPTLGTLVGLFPCVFSVVRLKSFLASK